MKITFLGATQEVTGSKYLIESENTKILVDCGLFQGEKELTKLNRNPPPVEPSAVNAIVLTHAHIDHTGYIPAFIKNGFRGSIYCSKATQALCQVLLLDCGSVQEEEAKKAIENNWPAVEQVPLYTKTDAQNS